MKYVAFLCGHNAGRSQMAQAFFNNLNKNEEYKAVSAGTNIASEVNRECVFAMKEIGIDMSNNEEYYPKKIETLPECAKVFTMGCNVKCDLPTDEDLGIDDPAGKPLEEVRIIRDNVREKIQKIVEGLA